MSEWSILPLSAIANIVTGSTPGAAHTDSWGDAVDFITPSDQQDNQREATSARRLSLEGARRMANRLVPPRSTNLTCIGSTIGKVSMTHSAAVTNQQINSIVARQGVSEADFIYYLIKNWSGSLKDHASGSATPIINKSVLSKFEFLIPPLREQRAIGEVLNALDDKIAANTKIAESTADLAGLEFSSAHTNANRVVRLSELVSTQYGVTTSAHGHRGPKFLRVTDINKKPWVEWDSTPNCTVSQLELSKYRVSPGDILVARMADPGKAAFIDVGDPEAVFASYLVRLKPHDPAQALYLYYFLRSPQYLEYAQGAMSGSVQKNMNAKVIVATDVGLPDSNRILQFNETVAPLRRLTQSHLDENRKLAATRDALLPQLMSGKLRVKDAEKVLEKAGV